MSMFEWWIYDLDGDYIMEWNLNENDDSHMYQLQLIVIDISNDMKMKNW